MGLNNFLPFCETDTGTNLPTQGDYAADPNRDIGNQPGVASSKLNNKPLRQATAISSALAQFLADYTTGDVLDDGNAVRLFSQMNASLLPIAPVITKYTSGSGTWNAQYVFFIDEGDATVGATYTNNAITYTVVETIVAGKVIKLTGSGDPSGLVGTLTKASGTGDATLSFFSYRKPIALYARLVGGGGGGGGSTGNGGAGGDSTFGTALLTAAGGALGNSASSGAGLGGGGGAATVNSPAVSIVAISGGDGGGSPGANNGYGGAGGVSAFGGSAPENIVLVSTGGVAAKTNSGSGGAGLSGGAAQAPGRGGGAGGYIEALISSPASSYAYSVGAAGAAGTGGNGGGAGGSGLIIIEEHYQ